MKFHRQFQLKIQTFESAADPTTTPIEITISPPFTIEFNIERSANSGLNTMEIRIYNLQPDTRVHIQHDPFKTDVYQRIELRAGYSGDLPIIFKGNIWEANSYREGSNIITSITCFDGGLDTITQRSFFSLEQGTTLKDAVMTMINQFPNVTVGKIGAIEGTPQRPLVVDGNTWEQIKKYTTQTGTGANCFIDLEKVNVLSQNEVIGAEVPVIDADTGLLETPRRDQNFLVLTTLFEPRIFVGQLIKLISTIQKPVYNGDYQVVGVSHQGVISEAVSGECRSTFSLILNNAFFGAPKFL